MCYYTSIGNPLAAAYSEEEYFDTTDQIDPVKQVELGLESESDKPTPGDDDPEDAKGVEREAAVIAADQEDVATREDTTERSSQDEGVATVAALDRAEELEAMVLEPREDRSAVQRTTEPGADVSEPDSSSTSECLEVNKTLVHDTEAGDSRTPFSDSKNEMEPEEQHIEATGETASESGNGQSVASGPERSGSDPEVDVTVDDRTAKAKAAYDQFLAETRRKAEELKEKGLCTLLVEVNWFHYTCRPGSP